MIHRWFTNYVYKSTPSPLSFWSSCCRYDEVANNVQTQETILNIQFVLLDCSPLKYAILSHCTEWQNKFTTLLSTIATSRLKELHSFLKDNGEKYVASSTRKCLGNTIVWCLYVWRVL